MQTNSLAKIDIWYISESTESMPLNITSGSILMNDSILMNRCFELALKGEYLAPPNPLVGCVIACKDKILAEGYHHQYGSAHAEPDALNKVATPELLKESTLVVNLEPCPHFGKTPPCVGAIIESGIRRVIIGTKDTSSKVNGRGIAQLRESGIEVLEGIEQSKARYLNRRFFTFHERNRPYIILKWAETSDGFIAKSDNQPEWISCLASRQDAHNQRAKEMAILVGRKTALSDNPELTARPENLKHSEYRTPLRLVIDKELTLPDSLNLLDQKTSTLVFNSKIEEKRELLEYCKIDFSQDVPEQILSTLKERKTISLIVEGGTITLNYFIKSGLWDEAHIYRSPKIFKSGVKAPSLGYQYQAAKTEQFEEDLKLIYYNHNFTW